MSRRPVSAAFAAVLEAAGFARHAAAGTGGLDAYRRPARAPWLIEARQGGDGVGGHVDVALTLAGAEAAALVGPVHRALSPAALASALPDIIASLEALAEAAERLRCPDCNGLEALQEDEAGPYLACGQPRRGRRPFDGGGARCRRNLVMAALIVYGSAAADAGS
jgi:hypothetical protein